MTDARCSPFEVTRKDVIVLLPALTAKRSFLPAASCTSPCVSRRGHGSLQPGCPCRPPLPPVDTAPICFKVPSAARLRITTWLSLAPLVYEYTWCTVLFLLFVLDCRCPLVVPE